MNFDQVSTGLLVPESRPTTFAPYAESQPIRSEAEIRSIIEDPGRHWGRKRWGNDWVYNQGQVGSCNACAAARALMRIREVAGLKHVELSAEYIYCGINGGSDRGSMLDDGMEWLMSKGTCPQSMVPHQTYRASRLRPETHNEAGRFKALDCFRVDSEMELASGLADGFIGVVAVEANNAYMRLDGDGVVSPTDGMGNHAVLVDDVRIHNSEYQFETCNSWGLNWGQQGYGWLSWKRHFRTTSRYHAFYLIRGCTDDTQADTGGDL